MNKEEECFQFVSNLNLKNNFDYTKVQVIDHLGKMVINREIKGYTIDVTNLGEGVYLFFNMGRKK